jgi:hypothetical protein
MRKKIIINQIVCYLLLVINSGCYTVKENGHRSFLHPLYNKRCNILLGTYNTPEANKEVIDIITKNDRDLDISNIFYSVMNESKTKFVAFFTCSEIKVGFEGSPASKMDTAKFMGVVINFCYYNVSGVYYNNRWFISKSGRDLTNCEDVELQKKETINQLQYWDYFKSGSTKLNPGFWETGFFSKVQDSVAFEKRIRDCEKQVAKNGKYKHYDEELLSDAVSDKINDGPYAGLYDIVAREMKKENENRNEHFKDSICNFCLVPLFDSIVKSDDQILKYAEFDAMSGRGDIFNLICSKNKEYIMCPILFTYKNNTCKLHYYFLLKSNGAYKIYEWKYFDPITPKYPNMYGGAIVDQIGSLTMWNFSFNYLWDENFWNSYVLKKDGNNKYVYLSSL